MLAYYVEWHMREAWRPLLFADEEQIAKAFRDPVAPAKRSVEAEEEGVHPHTRQWASGAQLPHVTPGSGHDRAQPLPRGEGGGCALL